jgi:hypothetical protein
MKAEGGADGLLDSCLEVERLRTLAPFESGAPGDSHAGLSGFEARLAGMEGSAWDGRRQPGLGDTG